MNKRQKQILIASSAIVFSTIILWIIYGMEIFTKTQVLVETKDQLFGWKEKKWVDKFVLGLDLVAAINFGLIIVSGFLYYTFRNKNK